LLDVDEDAVLAGLEQAWIDARFHVVPGSPKVVVDGAHNPDAVERLLEAFHDVYGDRQRVGLVFGAMRDKDVPGMVARLAPLAAAAVASPCGSARELEPGAIRDLFECGGTSALAASSP